MCTFVGVLAKKFSIAQTWVRDDSLVNWIYVKLLQWWTIYLVGILKQWQELKDFENGVGLLTFWQISES
jgi:hypothetical protein